MTLAEYLPFWTQLDAGQQEMLAHAAVKRSVPKGTLLHNGSADCVGLFIVCTGQLRAFILSPEGREVTIYRLFERDICLLSASCIMSSLQFDISIEAAKDSELWVIPPEMYRTLMNSSAAVANYTNELMAARFSEVMWLVEQVLWKSIDTRLAGFLIEESAREGGDTLLITHDAVAAHMGTAREVVTRMLRYFQSEDMVRLARGRIELKDRERLSALAK